MFEDATLLFLTKGHLISSQLDVYVNSFLPIEVLAFLGTVGFIFLAKVSYSHTKDVRKQELYLAYRQAMMSGDMLQAYEAGCAYYSFIKDGKMTCTDEETFHRELITMM